MLFFLYKGGRVKTITILKRPKMFDMPLEEKNHHNTICHSCLFIQFPLPTFAFQISESNYYLCSEHVEFNNVFSF